MYWLVRLWFFRFFRDYDEEDVRNYFCQNTCSWITRTPISLHDIVIWFYFFFMSSLVCVLSLFITRVNPFALYILFSSIFILRGTYYWEEANQAKKKAIKNSNVNLASTSVELTKLKTDITSSAVKTWLCDWYFDQFLHLLNK